MTENTKDILPPVRGRYTERAPLGTVGWFKTGGTAEILFKPADMQDLQDFLSACPPEIPLTVLGVLSNTIVRDGGVPGVTIRLGREFAQIKPEGETLRTGAAALDANIARAAAESGLSGLEFLSGIPGTIGGALKMNAGCYGTETKDVLIECTALDRQGKLHTLKPENMNMTYRHTEVPESLIFTEALLRCQKDEPTKIQARMAEIRTRRENSQPLREKTGGSTFANPSPEELATANLPPDTKVWQLIEKAGGRGLTVGGAQMSEKHCNFMINTGTATASDLETLGEEIRTRVCDRFEISLRWEIRRIGIKT